MVTHAKRPRQAGLCKFKASLIYTMMFKLAKVIWYHSISNRVGRL